MSNSNTVIQAEVCPHCQKKDCVTTNICFCKKSKLWECQKDKFIECCSCCHQSFCNNCATEIKNSNGGKCDNCLDCEVKCHEGRDCDCVERAMFEAGLNEAGHKDPKEYRKSSE